MTDPLHALQPEIAELVRRGMSQARGGHKVSARLAFERALSLDPKCHEALLWLAALAPDGETSLRYLARALELKPDDPRARAGLRWARKRARPIAPAQQPTVPMKPIAEPGLEAQFSAGDTQPSPSLLSRLSEPTRPAPRVTPPVVERKPERARRLPREQWALGILLVACFVAAVGLFGLSRFNGSLAAAIAQATSTPTPSATATATSTVPPTWTPTATSTETPTPTPTPIPTGTPVPPPTFTPVPPPPSADIPPAGGDPSARWIDIDLSSQSVTAYEGSTPVRTFIVSTGLPNTPTVTGQFRIYLRYDSQTMSGPGYYLPGVQWVQYFYAGYALHGTYWHNNFGRPMSHGCVNLTNADALWLYQWADYGTIVNVHY